MEVPNTSQIDNIAQDNMDFKSKMIHVLKKEIIIEKSLYLDAIASLQHLAAAELVHKIKHKIGVLSMLKSYNFAVTYEENLRQESTEGHEQFVMILETIVIYTKKIQAQL